MKYTRTLLVALGCALLPALLGCVSATDFRRLEYKVNRLALGGDSPGVSPGVAGEVLSDLHAEVRALQVEVARLEGRIEDSDYRVRALQEEVRALRTATGQHAAAAGGESGAAAAPDAGPPVVAAAAGVNAEALSAYRVAYDTWLRNDYKACIDHFSRFIQDFPLSDYTADANYWRGDCYFRSGDFEKAVLSFDNVLQTHPGNAHAADAMYRIGEAMLELGPSRRSAAARAFSRVIEEYPESNRAEQASHQLELLGVE